MSKVFIGGSRRLARLGKEVRSRLDNIIANALIVLVGDANGVDKAVQQYLSGRDYGNVIVFCAGADCRNNVGNWPTKRIAPADPARQDFSYYAAKDRAMVDETDYGLMLWDGRSRGTLTSIVDLIRHGKPVVVYLAPRKLLQTLRGNEGNQFLSRWADPNLLERIERDLNAAGRIGLSGQQEGVRNMSLF